MGLWAPDFQRFRKLHDLEVQELSLKRKWAYARALLGLWISKLDSTHWL